MDSQHLKSKASYILNEYVYYFIIALAFLLIGFILGQYKIISSVALFGFLGVIIGTLIASLLSIHSTKEQHKFQVSMIAVEKRLETHQKAFIKWVNIHNSIYDNKTDLNNAIKELRIFLNENLLYLDIEVENSLRKCALAASYHNELLLDIENNKDEIIKSWDRIMEPRNLIRSTCNLPAIPIPKEPSLNNKNQ